MMKRILLALGAALLMGAFSGGAQAQTMSYAQAGALIAKSCGPSIEKYCNKVNIGSGKVLGCLQAKQSSVPAQCFADYNAVVASLAKRVAAQAGAYKACQREAAQYCQGVQPGDSNIRDCLVDAKDVVRGTCRQTLIDAGWY